MTPQEARRPTGRGQVVQRVERGDRQAVRHLVALLDRATSELREAAPPPRQSPRWQRRRMGRRRR